MDPAHLDWFTSSYTGGQGGNCVEVAATADAYAVRDTKHRDQILQFTITEWAAFVTGTRRDEFT